MSAPIFANNRTWRTIDSVGTITPLGIQFWDAALDRPVNDRLIVEARPLYGGRVTRARATVTGIYLFHNLPGLAMLERDDRQHWPPAASRSFIVSVNDASNHFLPVQFGVQLPLPVDDGQPYHGLFRPVPNSDDARVYLFSAPSRSTPAGITGVRGQVVVRGSDDPVHHALIEVVIDGEEAYGATDVTGNFACLFPYPSFDQPVNGGSPADARLNERTWNLTVRVRYIPPIPDAPRDQLPDLFDLLGQPLVEVWNPDTETFTDAYVGQIRYGRDHVIRTGDETVLMIRTTS